MRSGISASQRLDQTARNWSAFFSNGRRRKCRAKALATPQFRGSSSPPPSEIARRYPRRAPADPPLKDHSRGAPHAGDDFRRWDLSPYPADRIAQMRGAGAEAKVGQTYQFDVFAVELEDVN